MAPDNRNRAIAVTFLIIVVVIVGILAWLHHEYTQPYPSTLVPPPSGMANTPASSSPVVSSVTAFDRSMADGAVTVSFPSSDFALATSAAQVLVHSYIPPCDQSFDYCLYYIGSAYSGTNFESAGISIDKRADLTTEKKCLTTEPDGFMNLVPAMASSSDYATSVFAPLGDAAAGHFANGALYRVYYSKNATCYELETRIGQTDYANYPAGAIKQFTDTDMTALQSEITDILAAVLLPTGEKDLFPAAPANQTNQ